MPPVQKVEYPHRSRLVHGVPFYYGWVILAAGTLGLIMTSPGQTYAVSIFIEHIIAELEISRSLVSTLYAAGTVIGSFALPMVGRAIDRRGPRFMVVLIACAMGLACIFMGLVRGAVTLGLGFIAIRLFGQGSLTLVSQNVMNQWWVRRRGTVMGISGLLLSLLGLGAFPALINYLIPHYGWRTTYMLLGGLLLLVMAPAGYIFFRERPELYGMQPDGRAESKQPHSTTATPIAEVNWTLHGAMRTPTFWMVAFGSATVSMLSTGLFFHMVSIFGDNGLAPAVAASVYLPIAATTALANLTGGALADRVRLRFLLAGSLFLLALTLWLARSLGSVPLAFTYGVVLGAATGLFRAVSAVAWAHYFGRLHLGSITGFATTILVFGAALGPIPFGVARDHLGSYNLALALSALLPLTLGLATLFMPNPQKTAS